MSITEAIKLLKTYSGPLGLKLHTRATEELISKVESTYNITLPADFKTLYRITDGFETVEDIFNMIPLAEIIENKKENEPLWIAEYMIYSGMWQLEIKPDDCNDYKIIVRSEDSKLVLTHSLAEFIERFLTGGVFDPGGMYDWQEEVELQPIYSTKLKTAERLLTIFYYGLRYNIISKKEVVDWADTIVMREDEPASFFIDMSLSHDKNELISLLHSKCAPGDDVVARAMLGLLYHRLSAGVIDVMDVINIMDKHDFFNFLPSAETACIYDITDELWMDELIFYKDELTQKVLRFLEYYKKLELTNYKHWLAYSYHVKYRLSGEEKKEKPAYPGKKNKQIIKSWVLYGIIYTLALISLIILIATYTAVENKMPLGKLRGDLYQLSQLYFSFFICYYILKAGGWVIKILISGFRKVFNRAKI